MVFRDYDSSDHNHIHHDFRVYDHEHHYDDYDCSQLLITAIEMLVIITLQSKIQTTSIDKICFYNECFSLQHSSATNKSSSFLCKPV